MSIVVLLCSGLLGEGMSIDKQVSGVNACHHHSKFVSCRLSLLVAIQNDILSVPSYMLTRFFVTECSDGLMPLHA